jgi:hypothetical protein
MENGERSGRPPHEGFGNPRVKVAGARGRSAGPGHPRRAGDGRPAGLRKSSLEALDSQLALHAWLQFSLLHLVREAALKRRARPAAPAERQDHPQVARLEQ